MPRIPRRFLTASIAASIAVCVCSGLVLAEQAARDSRIAPPAGGKASIAGTVVTVDTGRPVRRASVTISSTAPRLVRSVQTDDQGAFSFADLPAGEYTVSTVKGGFIESIYGQKQPGSGRPGTPIRIAEGQKRSNIALPLARGAVITGTVIDEAGEPAFGIAVRALRWSMQSGQRALMQAASATTDDRGVYRLHSLLPGDYVISAASGAPNIPFSLSEGAVYAKVLALESAGADTFKLRVEGEIPAEMTSGFARVFYPGTTVGSAATTVTLGPGEERAATDFAMQVVPLARVSGTLMGPTGAVSAATVQLVDEMGVQYGGLRSARTDNAGRFTFTGVAPGQYVLMTKATAKGAPQLEASGREAAEFLASQTDATKIKEIQAAIQKVAPLWATVNISVDGRNLTDLQLSLQPGLTVSGQVTTENGDSSVNLSRMTLNLSPVGGVGGDFAQAIPGTVDANGQFTIRGVTPGRYRLTAMAGMPAGHVLQSAAFGGQDILDFPLEIDGGRNVAGGLVTLSSQTTEVSGTVRDTSNQPAPGFTVIAFPSEDRLWLPLSRRIQAVRPTSDGRYQFRNLPSGDYRLIAVQDVEPGRWYDPAWLRQLAGFAIFSLTPGGKHSQDFQVR
ncbi:MAG TPA: carboxypeptidase regulatory-like domain-containing protein [Vicinamibacterales bacterium]|nr:carboxypeptidase regulatory-like domain-containing protein [Vicinamibacterales bacterium]